MEENKNQQPRQPVKIEYLAKDVVLSQKSIDKLVQRLTEEYDKIKEEQRRGYTNEDLKKSGFAVNKNGKVKLPLLFSMEECFQKEILSCFKSYCSVTEKGIACNDTIYKIWIFINEKFKESPNKYAEGLNYLAKFYLLRGCMLANAKASFAKYEIFLKKLQEMKERRAQKYVKYCQLICSTYDAIMDHDECYKIKKLVREAIYDGPHIGRFARRDPDLDDYSYSSSYSSSSDSSASSSSYGESSAGGESGSGRTVYTDMLGREVAHTDEGGYRLYDDRNNHIGYRSGNKIYDEHFDPVAFVDDSGKVHKL